MDWILAFVPLRYIIRYCYKSYELKKAAGFLTNILQVLGRTSRQVKQLRCGLKEPLIWPLVTESKDTIPILFPRMSDAQCTPQVNVTSKTLLTHGRFST